MNLESVKLKANGFLVPAQLEHDNGRIIFNFPYNKTLIDEIKNTFEGRKYHGYEDPPRKVWSIPADSEHNQFQLNYLKGLDPYAHYTRPLQTFNLNRETAREHQREGVNFMLTRRHCIYAGEMGVGKTFMTIEALEHLMYPDAWYVAPRSALSSARVDYVKWNARIIPEFMTYEGLVKRMKGWTPGSRPPRAVIFDEASRLKNHTSQRSQAAYHLAKSIREEFGYESLIVLLSGSPAPKSPADWWSLCRIARPGILKEGTLSGFQARYALLKKQDFGTGAFNQLVTWKDSERKCAICGLMEDVFEHSVSNPDYDHSFMPMPNEVGKLYKRMAGVVMVKLKKDCLDLPAKTYRLVQCDVTPETKRTAALIKKGARTTIMALTRLRELSDGFQYVEEEGPKEVCSFCQGKRLWKKVVHTEECGTLHRGEYHLGCTCPVGDEEPCEPCGATGYTKTFIRNTVELPCAKDEALEEILEDVEDYGRIVIYGGFTATIDRIKRVCQKQEWKVICLDGRGCSSEYGDLDKSVMAFQDKSKHPENIAFVGHPESAGMGLTLTAADTIVYYSNDFKAENRIQSEDRIHRMGMDINRGANIIDLIGLESDMLVLNNLKKKRELQSITLGEVAEASLEVLTQEYEKFTR